MHDKRQRYTAKTNALVCEVRARYRNYYQQTYIKYELLKLLKIFKMEQLNCKIK